VGYPRREGETAIICAARRAARLNKWRFFHHDRPVGL